MAQDDVQRILIELSEIKTLVQRTNTDVEDHEARLRSLEGKSGRKWEGMVTQLITLIVAAVFGLLMGKYI